MNKESLIAHLTATGGKQENESWDEIAKKHGYDSGETARGLWKKHRKKLGKIEIKQETTNYIADLEAKILSFEENIKNNTGEVLLRVPKAPETLEELKAWGLIDSSIWEIDKYIQNFWGSNTDPHWQVKAWLSKKTAAKHFQEGFIKFLETYTPPKYERKDPVYNLYHTAWTCLVINKQDSHLNKFDVKGDNDIDARFSRFIRNLTKSLQKATSTSHVENITYIIGSDEFNSEWTGMTTKGTPQQNILSYEDSFKAICDHEVEVIERLVAAADKVDVVYIPGNHDEYVGWHLINWLESYYRMDTRVSIDSKPDPTKPLKYGKAAMLFNHGDVMKPEKLAGIFAREFQYDLSGSEYFYIFTGDKHNTLAKDFFGYEFYQIPALSSAKSKWDIKNGHDSKPYLTCFLIDREDGLTNIIKQPIK